MKDQVKAKPINERVTLNGIADIPRLISFITGLFSRVKFLVVTITDKEEQRSHAQNRLYWKWLKQYGDYEGLTDDEAHIYFKKVFLIRLYARDDAEFNEMCQAVTTLKEAESEQFLVIANHVVKETSTRRATVKQFTEYLESIDRYCLGRGLRLDTPSDLMFLHEDKTKLRVVESVA